MMKRFAALGYVIVMAVLCALEPAHAVEFAIVGARAAGMGGAGVAVTTDAFATYWNPAGLAMSKTIDIRVQGSAQIIDRLGLLDTAKELDDLDTNNINNLGRAQDLANKINRPGATASGIGTAGIYLKGYFGDHAFGFSIANVATGGGFISSPVQVTQTGPNSFTYSGQAALRALEARQATFSYAYAFADRTLAIGVTGKIIQGAAYAGTATIRNGEDLSLTDDLGKAKTTTAFGIDVGALYRPSSWLRVGIVAKDINQPSFNAPGGGEFKLTPQVRGGVALNPWETLTLTADVDVTKNRTLVPDVKSQVISVGAEQTILSELLSLRLGAFKNTADANSYITPTAGLGVRLFALRVDVGGGYDFRERGALVSGTVALTF
jgi:hypothetical protein